MIGLSWRQSADHILYDITIIMREPSLHLIVITCFLIYGANLASGLRKSRLRHLSSDNSTPGFNPSNDVSTPKDVSISTTTQVSVPMSKYVTTKTPHSVPMSYDFGVSSTQVGVHTTTNSNIASNDETTEVKEGSDYCQGFYGWFRATCYLTKFENYPLSTCFWYIPSKVHIYSWLQRSAYADLRKWFPLRCYKASVIAQFFEYGALDIALNVLYYVVSGFSNIFNYIVYYYL